MRDLRPSGPGVLRLLREPRWLRGLALAVLVALVCCALGRWQWHRREERLAANAPLVQNYDRPAEPVARCCPRVRSWPPRTRGRPCASPAPTTPTPPSWCATAPRRPVRLRGPRPARAVRRHRPARGPRLAARRGRLRRAARHRPGPAAGRGHRRRPAAAVGGRQARPRPRRAGHVHRPRHRHRRRRPGRRRPAAPAGRVRAAGLGDPRVRRGADDGAPGRRAPRGGRGTAPGLHRAVVRVRAHRARRVGRAGRRELQSRADAVVEAGEVEQDAPRARRRTPLRRSRSHGAPPAPASARGARRGRRGRELDARVDHR